MDEERLITALKGQLPGAMQELVDSYGDRLLRSAFLLCGNETDAQDIVQDTFLQAIRSVHRFQGRSTIYTWLHGILLNLTRHYYRDRKRIVYDDELVGREVSPPNENPSQLDAGTASSALGEALRQLSAAHLGISKGTVKSRLHYAIGEMQKLLPGELNLFGPRGTEEIQRR